MDGAWFTTAGLVADLAGAGILAWPLFSLSDDQAIAQSASTVGGVANPESVKALIQTRRYTKAGLCILMAGFTLQLIGGLMG